MEGAVARAPGRGRSGCRLQTGTAACSSCTWRVVRRLRSVVHSAVSMLAQRSLRRTPASVAFVIGLAAMAAGCASAPPSAPSFAPSPSYREAALLSDESALAMARGVSQLDLLDDTDDDAARCSCAAAIHAYLLLGGDWLAATRAQGLSTVPTHESMHRLQERLYELADVDGEPGVFGGCRPLFDEAGRVVGWQRKDGDEVHRVFAELGLDAWPLYGPTAANLFDREAAVHAYFAAHPGGALIAGVDEDMATGASRPVAPGTFADHYVVVTRRDGRWLRLDSWAPLGADTLHTMDAEEVRSLVFQSPVTLFAVALAADRAR